MSGISTYQGGQSDLELAAIDAAVLVRPMAGNPILTNLEDSAAGGLDAAKIGASSGFITVGNWTKSGGVTLTNNPTINDVKSHGKGSPTRQIATEAVKEITYEPQEFKAINMQIAWGYLPSAVSAISAKGGFTISLPELPANNLYQVVLLAWDSYNGKDLIRYWIANKANVGKRGDTKMTDGDVDGGAATLTFTSHRALPGVPVIFGACGDGLADLINDNDAGFEPTVTGITVAPTTAAMTVATGAGHTQQLVVTDSNSYDRTSAATYVSSTPAKATVSASGLITAVATGTSSVTATWGGFTASCAVTVS